MCDIWQVCAACGRLTDLIEPGCVVCAECKDESWTENGRSPEENGVERGKE